MAYESRRTCFELRAALDKLFVAQADLARMCGVGPNQVWRWCDGKADIPQYVWTILALYGGAEPFEVLFGEIPRWKVQRHHVFGRKRGERAYKALAKRFHPDVTGRDTTAEMQLINGLR
jgi:hypothetical protein